MALLGAKHAYWENALAGMAFEDACGIILTRGEAHLHVMERALAHISLGTLLNHLLNGRDLALGQAAVGVDQLVLGIQLP